MAVQFFISSARRYNTILNTATLLTVKIKTLFKTHQHSQVRAGSRVQLLGSADGRGAETSGGRPPRGGRQGDGGDVEQGAGGSWDTRYFGRDTVRNLGIPTPRFAISMK